MKGTRGDNTPEQEASKVLCKPPRSTVCFLPFKETKGCLSTFLDLYIFLKTKCLCNTCPYYFLSTYYIALSDTMQGKLHDSFADEEIHLSDLPT